MAWDWDPDSGEKRESFLGKTIFIGAATSKKRKGKGAIEGLGPSNYQATGQAKGRP